MCDTMVACGDVTKSGRMIFGKNSDRSCNEPQYFVFSPAADHSEKTVKCTFIEVEQVKHTYATLLSKPSWVWGCEMGVNEFGLVMGNEAVYTREISAKEALLGMDIVRLTIERSKNCAEAIKCATELLETYGQGGNASFDGVFNYDNSFMIADGKEAWYLETAGKYWVTKKLSGAYAISNSLKIGKPDDMHPDIVKHAIENGYPVAEPFDFKNTYIDWSIAKNISGIVRRDLNQHMLEIGGNAIETKHFVDALRSHTTEDPWNKGDMSVCKHAIAIGNDSSSTNALIVEYLEDGFIMWGTGTSTPCIHPFQPMWFDTFNNELVAPYDKQEEAMDRWIKEEKLNRFIAGGRICEKEVREDMLKLQDEIFKATAEGKKENRQALCDDIYAKSTAFSEKWIAAGEGKEDKFETEEAAKLWAVKNEALGKDRRIAY